MRQGPELVRASNEFTEENKALTWRLFLTTLAVQIGLWVGIVMAPWFVAKLALSVLAGLVGVRLFIFYHDHQHGALFRKSKLGNVFMTMVGWYTIAVPSVWKETHDFHHRNNAKMTGSSIGSYPTVNLKMYGAITEKQRKQLKAVRHPITIVLGLFTTFMTGFAVHAFQRNRKKHWAAPVSLITWWAIQAGLVWAFGWTTGLLLWMFPTALHSAAGSYLFYAQHNYPEAQLRDRRKWKYDHAALQCSSFFEMSPLMHWFTGNIGYHHVHHLNHRIPFYRLPEAMEKMPELQNPGRTSWALKDIRACLNCSVWDESEGRLISFKEADAKIQAAGAMAAK